MYNYFATCFDSYESSLGINFKTYCTYFLQFSCLTVFCRTIAIGIPFLHYKTRVNVYMVLGRGVVVVVFGAHYCKYCKYVQ